MQRVAVVGTTGSGKSTLAANLARALASTYIDLDAIIWGPDWTLIADTEVRERLAMVLAEDSWVIAGNRRKSRDQIWGRADTLIWLDYPLAVILWRLWWRTWRRILFREELWGGNRERFRSQFLSRDSLLLYAVQTHEKKRVQILQDLRDPAYAHLEVKRFTSPRATRRWLETLLPPDTM